ncbi:MAG: 8-oxo-dGTP diphosphatase [Patescibacteria group bacterium]
MTEGTLVYIFKGNQVLLAMKKRGFGQGKWNGAGGKLKAGETARAAAKREVKEEIEVDVTLAEPQGRIHFHDPGGKEWLVHVFRTEEYQGEPRETEEMRPQWWPVEAIPYDQCWADDRVWLPRLIQGKKFEAEVWLADDGSLQKHAVKELPA